VHQCKQILQKQRVSVPRQFLSSNKKYSSSSVPNNSVVLSKMIQKRMQKKTPVAQYIGLQDQLNIHACNGTLLDLDGHNNGGNIALSDLVYKS
jgi:hypothetical protein